MTGPRQPTRHCEPHGHSSLNWRGTVIPLYSYDQLSSLSQKGLLSRLRHLEDITGLKPAPKARNVVSLIMEVVRVQKELCELAGPEAVMNVGNSSDSESKQPFGAISNLALHPEEIGQNDLQNIDLKELEKDIHEERNMKRSVLGVEKTNSENSNSRRNPTDGHLNNGLAVADEHANKTSEANPRGYRKVEPNHFSEGSSRAADALKDYGEGIPNNSEYDINGYEKPKKPSSETSFHKSAKHHAVQAHERTKKFFTNKASRDHSPPGEPHGRINNAPHGDTELAAGQGIPKQHCISNAMDARGHMGNYALDVTQIPSSKKHIPEPIHKEDEKHIMQVNDIDRMPKKHPVHHQHGYHVDARKMHITTNKEGYFCPRDSADVHEWTHANKGNYATTVPSKRGKMPVGKQTENKFTGNLMGYEGGLTPNEGDHRFMFEGSRKDRTNSPKNCMKLGSGLDIRDSVGAYDSMGKVILGQDDLDKKKKKMEDNSGDAGRGSQDSAQPSDEPDVASSNLNQNHSYYHRSGIAIM